MKYLDYVEKRRHGSVEFPFAYYDVRQTHPRYEMMYHWHTEFEIIRILSGTFAMTINGSTKQLKQGDIVFISGGTLHGGVPSNSHYECLVFDLDHLTQKNQSCSKLIQAISAHEKKIKTIIPPEDNDIHQICASLFETMKNKESGYQFFVFGYFYCLLGLIVKHQYFEQDFNISLHHQEKIKQIKKVLAYMDSHYQENISLSDIAAVAGMNSRYFCSFFKKSTQKTPMEYLHYYRVEQACGKLAAKNQSITDIALDCGFNDGSYFTKVFRKYKGMTPVEYQKTISG